MIKQAYINGFMRKCAEYRIDPNALLKLALDPAALGTTTMPTVPPPKPMSTTRTSRSSGSSIISVSHDHLRKAMEKVLAERRGAQHQKTSRQPLLITR